VTKTVPGIPLLLLFGNTRGVHYGATVLESTVSTTFKTLRLGTRGSLLARTQSQLVATQLESRHPGRKVELVIIKTTGDVITDKPLHDAGGKGLFVKELELALLAGTIDFAVHSYKDVPVTMPLVEQGGLVIAATPLREDPRDVAIMRDPSAGVVLTGRVGTTSLRRRCQVLATAPDCTILPLRGNIDTRIRKLKDGEYDVILLAMAGLKRAGLFDPTYMTPLDPIQGMLPAPGQGALALQCRRDDAQTRQVLAALHDPATETCVNAERELVRMLEGDCHSPIAALATLEKGGLVLSALVGARDGGATIVQARADGMVQDAERIVGKCFGSLREQGAIKLLRMQVGY
jgi:hydroxymethylbilane synthase